MQNVQKINFVEKGIGTLLIENGYVFLKNNYLVEHTYNAAMSHF